MTLFSLRRLAAGGALALAALISAPVAQAQALHPLSPAFLATLNNVDTSSDEIGASVMAIKNADLTYSMFSRGRVEKAIANMEQQLPALKAQTASLRREESLRVLLAMRTAFSDAQRNIGSISDILHGVTVRTPAQADALDKLLARLDSATAQLDAALKRFDSGAVALTARASSSSAPAPGPASAPAAGQAQVPMSPASVQAQAGASSAQAQAAATPGQAAASSASGAAQAPGAFASAPASTQAALRPLPPNLLATLKDVDTSSDEMAASVTAVKNADLTYSLFSRGRVEKVIARMEKQLPMLKAQTADLRRDESLGVLLSMRTAFSEVQRDVGSVSEILHGVTVRTPAQADELDRLLTHLDAAAAHLDAALKRFDTGALAMIELLDKPAR
ncbi:MAG: hypothetical protein JWN73_3302 [Betaproteobacteria bacterium]|nr:hypothetical protein [Betaproteobacteria bacterium]